MAFSFSTPSSSSTAPKPFSFNTPASAAPSTPFSFATPAASTSNTNQNNTPSLFGQPNAGSSSAGTLFGTGGNAAGQSATTGLFGAAAPKSKQQPATGGLFGSAPAPASTGNNLFGQPQPQQNATGLFGNTAGSSLFGQPAQSQAQPTTGLFGSANQPFGQNSLFSQQPPQQSQPNTGSFGSQPQQNTFGSGLFGSTANQGGSSSLFGQNQQQQPSMQNSLFAGSAPALGSSQMPNSSLAQSVIGMNASQNALSQQQDEPIDQRILKIKNAYDPNNLSANAFQAYVYNVMDQQRANYVAQNGGKHTRTPQDTQNDALWLKAQRENPDPNRYYPQLIVGHDALKKRVAQQEDFAQKHKAKLEEIASQVQQLSSVQTLQTSIRLSKASHNQAVLSARLIRLVARIPALTSLRSTPVTADEEALKARIEALAARFAGETVKHNFDLDLNGHGKMSNKVNELWIAVAQLKAKRAYYGSSEDAQDQTWTISNQEEVNRVLEVLTQQQRTLDYLGGLLRKDEAVLNVIKAGFNEPPVAKSSERR